MKKSLLLLLLTFTVISLTAQRSLRKEEPQFGKNILAFSPVQLMANNHVGVGLSYERLVNQYVGLRIPVMVGINSNYVNVGLEAKLYPTRNNGPVKYAIAPMIMYGNGKTITNEWVYDPNLGYSVYVKKETPRSHFGFLLNQTFNFTILKNFYIGIDGGLGVNYYDSDANKSGANNSQMSVAAQLGFGLGYRF